MRMCPPIRPWVGIIGTVPAALPQEEQNRWLSLIRVPQRSQYMR